MEDVTGSRSIDPARRRLKTLVADQETTTPIGSILTDQEALFMESTTGSTWRGAVEKVRINKARLHYTQVASSGQRASSVRSNKYEDNQKSRT